MKICFLLALATILFGCSGPYAIEEFETYTGLEVKPHSSFQVCQGATDDVETCKPPGGAGSGWIRVSDVDPLLLNINPSNPNFVESASDKIFNFYIGAGFAEDVLINGCQVVAPTMLFENQRRGFSPRLSSYAQTVEATVLNNAETEFEALLEGSSITNKGQIRTAFSSALRDSLRSNSSNNTDIVWITSYVSSNIRMMSEIEELQDCISQARAGGGSLVTGVAGFILTSNESGGEYVSQRTFERVASLALQGSMDSPLPDGIDSNAVANAGARWSRNTNRLIRTNISTSITTPIFHPLWVLFSGKVGSS
ncbi:hypothetical protein [Rubrivirga litoralis]|uniref:Uncharacterized protein n=1 Tax=Rubrivirga litoralis TaxID=3075598 RepID=A0ABU3BVI2_9BACT|nr:hypothetical protein [Rubrivirga sp. F394]MDT0633295.1 hypothetical protein [Rubrivirga sp. F394]